MKKAPDKGAETVLILIASDDRKLKIIPVKVGLDGKSFFLGAIAGALVVATLGSVAAGLFLFLRSARVMPATRVAPPTPTLPGTAKIPVEGTWFNVKYPGRPCSIMSTPKGLVITDQNGAVSRLEYDPAGFVIAIDWRGGLRGDVETNTIRWAHGGVWVREPPEKQL